MKTLRERALQTNSPGALNVALSGLRAVIVVWLSLAATTVYAKLDIEITKGLEGALPIAVVPFGWQGPGAAPEDIAAIVRADLARSGRFAPLPPERLVARPEQGGQVDFGIWRAAGIDNLVVGRIQAREAGRYTVEFQLFDVLRGQQLAGYSVPTDAARLRRTAHQISDIVYERLTGQRGAFDTHIAYVTVEKTGDGQRRFRLAVADADGYNEQNILTSSKPLMSPAWAPDGRRLAYVSFETGRSVVYVQDVTTGERKAVAAYEGTNSAPAWSPDGKRLALALSRDGDAEVYIMDLASGRLTRVTRSYSIDTEPAWSPDGKALVFTSDRGGRPQIYRVSVGPRGALDVPRRLTFEGDYNARAAFSPDGRYLAMIHGSGGRFRIALQELESGNLRVLTDTSLDESPSFAPNGSMIIFATEVGNRGVLEVVSVDGRARQRLGLHQGDVREPAWSPYIK